MNFKETCTSCRFQNEIPKNIFDGMDNYVNENNWEVEYFSWRSAKSYMTTRGDFAYSSVTTPIEPLRYFELNTCKEQTEDAFESLYAVARFANKSISEMIGQFTGKDDSQPNTFKYMCPECLFEHEFPENFEECLKKYLHDDGWSHSKDSFDDTEIKPLCVTYEKDSDDETKTIHIPTDKSHYRRGEWAQNAVSILAEMKNTNSKHIVRLVLLLQINI